MSPLKAVLLVTPNPGNDVFNVLSPISEASEKRFTSQQIYWKLWLKLENSHEQKLRM